jgi:raffinose/stachyose/melibiose transport system permease protein
MMKQKRLVDQGRNLFSVTFLAPAFITYTLFIVFSVLTTFRYSFLKWEGLGTGSFTGVSNFMRMFRDAEFWQSCRNSLLFVVFYVVIENVMGLILAFMVSRISLGYRFFRSLYFIPVVVTATAVSVMFNMFYTDTGVVNMILRAVGLGNLVRPWLSDVKLVIYCVMLPEIWQFTGVYFLIFLAGVQTIPEEVIESARMDGARSPRILVQIIVPMMSEVVQIGVLFALINALKSFNFSWLMTSGGPNGASTYVSVYMYKMVFQSFSYGYGSAVSVVLLFFIVIITVSFKSFFNRITRDIA